MVVSPRGTSIEEEYVRANPTSQRLFQEQQGCVPGGVTHSSRAFDPFPLFIERCLGARKWDVDGHEYVDYWMGHGANLLGHGDPAVVAVIQSQTEKGLHAGGETELASEWARLVCRLVPSAEHVRFMASGGEATQMALRLARAFTGKNRIIKFEYHFHGWHDAVSIGTAPPLNEPASDGIPPSVLQNTVVLPANDIAAVRETLDRDEDIAGVILEPAGAYNDTIPSDPSFLKDLRELTRQRGVVLIFDEVVTGFRYAPGGAQEYFGVTPDMTTLGKILGGGLPAGAVAGRADIMSSMAGTRGSGRHVPQQGTWNANPLAAAAGVATLKRVATGEPIAAANQRAKALRIGLDEVFRRLGVPGGTYGRTSIWKTYLGERPQLLGGDYTGHREDSARLYGSWASAAKPLRQALLLNGVDTMRTNGFMSAAHTEDDIERTVLAFERALMRLRDDGLVATG